MKGITWQRVLATVILSPILLIMGPVMGVGWAVNWALSTFGEWLDEQVWW